MRIHFSTLASLALASLLAAGCAVPTGEPDAADEQGKTGAVSDTRQALFGQTPTLTYKPFKIDGAGFSPSSSVQVWVQDANTFGRHLAETVQTTAFAAPPHCNLPNFCEAFTGGTFEVSVPICEFRGGTATYWGYDVASGTWSAPVSVPVSPCRFPF